MKFFLLIAIIVTVSAASVRKEPYRTQGLGQYCVNGKEYCQSKYVCSPSPKQKREFKKGDPGICIRSVSPSSKEQSNDRSRTKKDKSDLNRDPSKCTYNGEIKCDASEGILICDQVALFFYFPCPKGTSCINVGAKPSCRPIDTPDDPSDSDSPMTEWPEEASANPLPPTSPVEIVTVGEGEVCAKITVDRVFACIRGFYCDTSVNTDGTGVCSKLPEMV